MTDAEVMQVWLYRVAGKFELDKANGYGKTETEIFESENAARARFVEIQASWKIAFPDFIPVG